MTIGRAEGAAPSSASLTPRQRCSTLALLAIVPCTALAASVLIERAIGGHWIGAYYDPDYQYLLNSLNLAEGAAPRHIDHPGTTVQELGAVVLIIRHWMTGAGDLRGRVLGDPESAVLAITVCIRAMYSAALLIFGWCAYRLTASRCCAIAAQAASGVSLAAVHSLWRLSPEPVVMALTLLLGSTTLGALARPERRGLALWSGLIGGLALTAKITALPALLVPLWGVVRNRRWIAYFLMVLGIGLLAASPILGQSGRMLDWFTRLALNDGRYGHSQGHLILDPGRYLFNLRRMITGEPVAAAAAALGLALLGYVGVPRRWHALSPRARSTAGALVCTVVAAGLQYIIVAKHPGARYLLPAVALAGLMVTLMWVLLVEVCTPRERRLVAALALLGLAIHAGQVASRLARDVRNAAIERPATVALHERALEETARAGGVLLTMYGSSSPAYGLAAADYWAGGRYARDLARLFPSEAAHNEWTGACTLRGEPFTGEQMRDLAAQGRLFFQMHGTFPAPELAYDILAGTSGESLYRMRPPSP
jgi:hypothetical protein